MYAQVAVENVNCTFDKDYDYSIPQQLEGKALVGCRGCRTVRHRQQKAHRNYHAADRFDSRKKNKVYLSGAR